MFHVKHPICSYEGVPYSSKFWKGREYEDLAERIALRRLLPQRTSAILDVGAGFGRLADLYSGAERVVLLDCSLSQLREARERHGHDPRFSFLVADLYNLPFPEGTFDTIVMVRVIHHVADVPAALSEIRRVTKEGGTFILEYANKRHLKAVTLYFLGRRPSPFSPEPLEFAPLHYDFHPVWLEKALREAGFALVETLALSFFRLPMLKKLFPPRFLAMLDGLLQKPLAPLKLTPSVIVKCLARPQG
jgi:ubiquinone/menaquinone biosynthesis C-methylase UbiE